MKLPEADMYKTLGGDLYTAAHIYTAVQMREYRNAALEEAALVCDQEAMDESDDFAMRRMESCARNIRSLKELK